MKWDDDDNCYEKRLLLDAVIKFSNEFRDLEVEEISVKMLYEFIDRFFEQEKRKSMNENWIDWNKFTVPEDVKGIFIKYEDGFIEADRYDYETKKRKYRDSKIAGWKFMERRDLNKKTVKCSETPNFSEDP